MRCRRRGDDLRAHGMRRGKEDGTPASDSRCASAISMQADGRPPSRITRPARFAQTPSTAGANDFSERTKKSGERTLQSRARDCTGPQRGICAVLPAGRLGGAGVPRPLRGEEHVREVGLAGCARVSLGRTRATVSSRRSSAPLRRRAIGDKGDADAWKRVEQIVLSRNHASPRNESTKS